MPQDDISEAEYLDSQTDQGASEWFARQRSQELIDERVAALERLKRLMRGAKDAETGSTIRCAQCEKRIVKRSYQTAFCSNAKTHGKRNCKDLYHNRIAGLEKYLAQREE